MAPADTALRIPGSHRDPLTAAAELPAPYGHDLLTFGTQAAEDCVIVNFQPTRVRYRRWRQLIQQSAPTCTNRFMNGTHLGVPALLRHRRRVAHDVYGEPVFDQLSGRCTEHDLMPGCGR